MARDLNHCRPESGHDNEGEPDPIQKMALTGQQKQYDHIFKYRNHALHLDCP